MTPALSANHALIAVSVVFAGLALCPFLPASEPPPHRPAALPAAPPTLAALPPVGQFAAIAERPLFSPSRRPAAVAAASGAVAGALDTRYRLLGVLLAGREQRALLLEGTHRLELGVGERLEGYTVMRIEQNRVMLTSPAGDAALALRPAADPPKPPAR